MRGLSEHNYNSKEKKSRFCAQLIVAMDLETVPPPPDASIRMIIRPANIETELEPCYALHRAAMHDLVEAVFGPWDESVQRKMFQADWTSEERRNGTEEVWLVVVGGEDEEETFMELDKDATVHLPVSKDVKDGLAAERVVLGALAIVNRIDDLHISQISVDPSVQGQGLGYRLLKWVKGRACERQLAVTLEVWNVNEGAMRLYKRNGFRKIGEKDGPGRRLKTIMKWDLSSEE